MHFEVVSKVVSKVRDHHNRLTLFTPAMLIEYKKQFGNAVSFSSINPTGHYQLNLSNQIHREIAKCLLFINKQNYDKIVKGEAFDRSPQGTKSCFRNEQINKGGFKWSPVFVLPSEGTFEFDFVYFSQTRFLSPSEEMTEEQLDSLKNWFV